MANGPGTSWPLTLAVAIAAAMLPRCDPASPPQDDVLLTQPPVPDRSGLQPPLARLIDNADELRTYLESEGGKQLMQGIPVEKASPYGRILGSIQAGVILSLGGLAVFLVRNHVPGESGEGFAMMFLGALGIAIGLGFLISAIASFWLSRSWGLLNSHEDR